MCRFEVGLSPDKCLRLHYSKLQNQEYFFCQEICTSKIKGYNNKLARSYKWNSNCYNFHVFWCVFQSKTGCFLDILQHIITQNTYKKPTTKISSLQNVSSKYFIKMFHKNVWSKWLLKASSPNASSKHLIKMSHKSVS